MTFFGGSGDGGRETERMKMELTTKLFTYNNNNTKDTDIP
jgi:hypothetical protein